MKSFGFKFFWVILLLVNILKTSNASLKDEALKNLPKVLAKYTFTLDNNSKDWSDADKKIWAEYLLNTQQFSAAGSILKDLILKDYAREETLFMLGLTQFYLKQYPASYEIFSLYAQIYNNDPYITYYQLLAALYANNWDEKSEQLLNKARLINFKACETNILAAMADFKNEDYETAQNKLIPFTNEESPCGMFANLFMLEIETLFLGTRNESFLTISENIKNVAKKNNDIYPDFLTRYQTISEISSRYQSEQGSFGKSLKVPGLFVNYGIQSQTLGFLQAQNPTPNSLFIHQMSFQYAPRYEPWKWLDVIPGLLFQQNMSLGAETKSGHWGDIKPGVIAVLHPFHWESWQLNGQFFWSPAATLGFKGPLKLIQWNSDQGITLNVVHHSFHFYAGVLNTFNFFPADLNSLKNSLASVTNLYPQVFDQRFNYTRLSFMLGADILPLSTWEFSVMALIHQHQFGILKASLNSMGWKANLSYRARFAALGFYGQQEQLANTGSAFAEGQQFVASQQSQFGFIGRIELSTIGFLQSSLAWENILLNNSPAAGLSWSVAYQYVH